MWVLWFLLGIILLIGEMMTPAFMMGCFAVGCFAAGIASYFEFSLIVQLISFALLTFLIFIILRPLLLKYMYQRFESKTNVDALIGKHGYVSQPIVSQVQHGRVIVGGEDWKGVSANGTPIEKGIEVVVLQVDGTKLLVEPVRSSIEKGKENERVG